MPRRDSGHEGCRPPLKAALDPTDLQSGYGVRVRRRGRPGNVQVMGVSPSENGERRSRFADLSDCRPLAGGPAGPHLACRCGRSRRRVVAGRPGRAGFGDRSGRSAAVGVGGNHGPEPSRAPCSVRRGPARRVRARLRMSTSRMDSKSLPMANSPKAVFRGAAMWLKVVRAGRLASWREMRGVRPASWRRRPDRGPAAPTTFARIVRLLAIPCNLGWAPSHPRAC